MASKVQKWVRAFEDYADNPPPMGHTTSLTIQRYHKMRKDERYYFDIEAVKHVFEFIAKSKHTAGKYAGKPFSLMPFQAFIIANLYGFYRKDTGTRLFTRSYVTMARKSGKTELWGVLLAYHLLEEGVGTPEGYVLANKYDQSVLCWNAARRIIKYHIEDGHPEAKQCQIYDAVNARRIIHHGTDGILKPLAAASRTLDGLIPSCVVIDEWHEAVDDGTLRVMQSGMVNRENPTLNVITTRGFHINGICHRYEKVMRDVLNNRKEDDSTFCMMFELDHDDNWEDDSVWHKANPGLGVTLTMEALRSEYTRARNEGVSAEASFRTKNLNQWVKQKKSWVDYRKWLNNPRLERDKQGESCYMGVDLATNYDLTAVVLFFPDPDGEEHVAKCWFFAPEDGAKKRARKDQVPYLDWEREGVLTLTPGAETDFAYIEQKIIELYEEYDILGLGYDPWHSKSFIQRLENDYGIQAEKFGQTPSNYNEPINAIERWISKGVLNCEGHPIMDWMTSNVRIKTNASGLKMFDKEKSSEKIDGWVALGAAVGVHMDDVEGEASIEVLVA